MDPPGVPLNQRQDPLGLDGKQTLRQLGVEAVPHGFRSSFRDWCAESGQPREIAEAALAHTVQGVEGAYFRSDLFEQRRQVMEAWGDYIS